MENTVRNPFLKCVTDRFDFLFQTTAGEIGIRQSYIPQVHTQNIDLILWHAQLIMCAVECQIMV